MPNPNKKFNPDAFIEDAKDGDLKKVKDQFDTEGFDIDARDKDGYTALHLASIWP